MEEPLLHPLACIFHLRPDKASDTLHSFTRLFFEGIVLFVVLWNLRKLNTPKGAMLSFYIIGYGLVRFFIEFYRQPDSHIGFVFISFSMGHLLCGLMMVCGAALYIYLSQTEKRGRMIGNTNKL